MLGKRLELATKKAEKRWKYFHLETWNKYLKTGFGPYGMSMKGFPVVGTYRKRKGCECRGCSIGKQHEKRARVLKIRKEKIPL